MNRSFKHLLAVPDELKGLLRWVNWQFIEREGKSTKVPVDPNTGDPASCADPGTWGTYAEALARFNRDTVDGIGFQLGDSYAGIDLDDCRNRETGEIEPWAQEIIDGLNTYAEISPSGNGVHILAKGSLPPRGRRKGQVEMYSSGRFLTMTGAHLKGTPTAVEERQVALDKLHAQIFGAEIPRPDAVAASAGVLSDEELLDRARNSENGEKFARLWSGDHTGYDSPSEADLALCMILAFWTGRNAGRIDSLFRQSGLFRLKWDDRHSADGRTYGQLTVEKAVEGTSEVWNQPVATAAGATAGNGTRPTIVFSNRQLSDVTEEAVAALQSSNSPPVLFVRTGQIVRVRNDEDHRPIIDIVGESELRARLAFVSDAVRFAGRSANPLNCSPRRDVIQNILAAGEWPFPPLQGIAESPVLRPDGTILSTPGYDEKTRLLYLPALGLDVPEISQEPTQGDVAASIEVLEETIGEFPFADEASKANALATMLTPLVRPAIKGKTPLSLIDAPQMGTGKGLLSEVIGVISTGRDAAMMAAPREEEEWRKRITATLMGGSSVIIIDNVEGTLDSAALASVLTAREWTDRVLGLSRMATIPVRATWIANGNNIKVGGDIARRCYWVRLDAKTARPWKRSGFKHPDLLQWVSDNRGEVLAALLTLARAWFAAGKPNSEIPAVGGFDGWARTVGGVLEFAGVTGFLKNLDGLYDTADESSLQWEQFLVLLASTFNDERFTVKQVVEHAQFNEEFSMALPDDVAPAGDKEGSIQRRLGKAFSKREGRRYGDLDIHLERAGMESRAVKWCVVRG